MFPEETPTDLRRLAAQARRLTWTMEHDDRIILLLLSLAASLERTARRLERR